MLPNTAILLQKFCTVFEYNWKIALNELNAPEKGQLVGGNRFRPQMCFLGYLAAVDPASWNTKDFSMIADVSVSIELLHKASLILDDWIDHDSERRGKQSLHVCIGPERSVLLAIKTVAYSMQRLKKRFGSNAIPPQCYHLCLDVLIETTLQMATGAYQELSADNALFFDYNTVKKITELQTSEILGNSLLLGYYVSAGELQSSKVGVELKWIGDQCGYIFQVMNDLEAFYNPQKLIQHKGSLNLDVTVHRKNLAVALLYQVADKNDKSLLINTDKDSLVMLMQKYKIFEFFQHDINLVYAAIIERIDNLKKWSISPEWCSLFRDFLGVVKKYAEERL